MLALTHKNKNAISVTELTFQLTKKKCHKYNILIVNITYRRWQQHNFKKVENFDLDYCDSYFGDSNEWSILMVEFAV
jgi:hypothetical protein